MFDKQGLMALSNTVIWFRVNGKLAMISALFICWILKAVINFIMLIWFFMSSTVFFLTCWMLLHVCPGVYDTWRYRYFKWFDVWMCACHFSCYWTRRECGWQSVYLKLRNKEIHENILGDFWFLFAFLLLLYFIFYIKSLTWSIFTWI